jgi:ABC-type transport system involved in Fe-S cluster assembly fused permease/ATPase subunit
MVTLFIVIIIDYFGAKWDIKKISWMLPHSVYNEMVTKLMSLSIGQTQSSHSGLKQSVINRGKSAVRVVINTTIFEIAPLLLQILIATIFMLFLAPQVGVIVLITLVIIGSLIFFTNPYFIRGFPELIKHANNLNKHVADFLKNMSLVKITTQSEQVNNHINEAHEKERIQLCRGRGSC